MAQPSSYLRFLPPGIYQDDQRDPDFGLGGWLRIPEKILTGITDGVVADDGSTIVSIKSIIDAIPTYFDPWRTPAKFLDSLASWVSLSLPATFNEYQKRKLLSEIVGTYQQRGSRDSLAQYMNIYTVADKRPIVLIGEGGQVFRMTPQPDRLAPVESFATHQPILCPQGIAAGPDKTMFVADGGRYPFSGAGTWRLDQHGYVFTGQPLTQQRMVPPLPPLLPNQPLFRGYIPKCVCVDNNPAASAFHVYVLRLRGAAGLNLPALHRAAAPGFVGAAMDNVATEAQLGMLWPLAMLFQPNGHLLILDRGVNVVAASVPPSSAFTPTPAAGAPRPQKIIEVTLDATGASFVSKIDHPFSTVLDPASFCQLSNGDLIVGDARESNLPTPADLVRVSPANGWSETRLLAGVANNPLVAPVGIVRIDDQHLYVLDAGLKPYEPYQELAIRNDDPNVDANPFVPPDDKYNPFLRQIANYPAVYSVDLSAPTPVIKQVSESGRLTRPTGMVLIDDTLYIADMGVGLLWYFTVPNITNFDVGKPSVFTVEVNFTRQRPTTPKDRQQTIDVIEQILTQEKPANAELLLIAFT